MNNLPIDVKLALGIGGALVLMGFVQGAPKMQADQAVHSQLQTQARTNALVGDLNTLAQERWDSGLCVELVSTTTGGPRLLSEGLQVWGPEGEPVPDGLTVCDRWGGTGITQGGYVTNYAKGQTPQPLDFSNLETQQEPTPLPAPEPVNPQTTVKL